MSTLQYNGITLQIVRTKRYDRSPVYDPAGMYMYSRHEVEVEAIFAPSATAYNLTKDQTRQAGVNPPRRFVDPVGAAPGADPTFQGAKPPPPGVFQDAPLGNITDRAVRHLLMQPRARLVYTAGGPGSDANPYQSYPTFRGGLQASIILDVPERRPDRPPPDVNPEGNPAGFKLAAEADQLATDPDPAGTWGGIGLSYVCDVTGGPHPLYCRVWRLDGTGTFRVLYGIRADINEETFFFNRPPVLISHTWSMSIAVDADGFSSREIQGTAVFRRDVLEQQVVRPDDFRSLLMHPIPAAMKRDSLQVGQLEDGNTLRYRIVDREFSHRVFYPNVTRVEAVGRIGMRRLSAERTANEVVGAVAALAARNVVRAVYNILPSAYVDAVVRVWGNRLSTIEKLRNAATRILVNRLGEVTQDKNSISVEEAYDWVGRYVEVHWRIELAGVLGALSILGLRNLANGVNAQNLPNINNILRDYNLLADSTIERNADGLAPPLTPAGTPVLDARIGQRQEGRGFRTLVQNGKIVGEDGSKGTYLGAVVAQLFWDGSNNPPLPPLEPTVQNLKTTAY